MPLKVTLKPGEKILVGTAVLANGPTKSEIVILNRVPVLRQKDIMTLEEATTVTRKLYYTILNMYTSSDQGHDYHEVYSLLIRQIVEMSLSDEALEVMHDMSSALVAGDHYRALKHCRKLIEYEEEFLKNGEKRT
ncbi:flagellar biosynthesis repressor FlbT [Phaeovibrio sulfidiphilus]|uniref:Flagellar biosynthesis repressor FlbT n=1 Tax=Phaeovibrio sulfidiphilus TaxID=1220600 RepID=A0A8J6YM65_9PROT|nr:flagellar biosynthesis repressor FlbT [Phaeovibrio sulfidiphilus]MBE1236980.1 flagellar biosynthesis repressor FlbT [Phaeovibrio sulfidiphilus]